MRGMTRSGGVALLAGLLCASALPAAANVAVRVEPAAATLPVGTLFDVSIVADLDDPVLAWGLDLSWDPGVIAPTGAPQIDALWNLPVATPDGDGLAGAYLPPPSGSGISGSDVVLAVIEFEALAQGTSGLVLSASAADLTEGFALDPMGFEANVSFAAGSVTVVPEPATALLLGGALAALGAARRRATGAGRADRRR
jgi:PEP-CTERM motif